MLLFTKSIELKPVIMSATFSIVLTECHLAIGIKFPIIIIIILFSTNNLNSFHNNSKRGVLNFFLKSRLEQSDFFSQ